MPAVGPGVPQALFSQDHQHRSTTVVAHLELLWDRWRQLRPWPRLALVCLHPQSPQLLRPDSSQPQKHLLFVQMSCRCRIYKASSRGVNPWLTQPWGEISALLPNSCGPWGSAAVSAVPLYVGNLLAFAPGACGGGGWGRSPPWWAWGAGACPTFAHFFWLGCLYFAVELYELLLYFGS